jgi:hypothetical protein
MKFDFRHIIISSLLAFCCTFSFSQVSVKASVDRDKILIGEPVRLTLQAYTPLGEPVTWFALDTIPGFEVIEKGKLDTSENVDGKKLEQTLIITSFDSGAVQFPPLSVMVGDRSYFTDSLTIDVAYSNFDPNADYRDIKEIVEVENPSMRYVPWVIGAVTLLCIGLITWLLWKRRRRAGKATIVTSNLTPYEEAMEALDLLKQMDWREPGATKIYYTQLNDILRVFLLRKLHMSSLEKTNDELILHLHELGLNKDSFIKLAQALRMSDFVKFARYQPQKADNDHNWEVIQAAVKTLNNIPIEN